MGCRGQLLLTGPEAAMGSRFKAGSHQHRSEPGLLGSELYNIINRAVYLPEKLFEEAVSQVAYQVTTLLPGVEEETSKPGELI